MLVSVVTHLLAAVVGGVGGVFVWPHLSSLWTEFQQSRAIKSAAALVAKAEADAAALEAARKVVAAQPKPTVAPSGTSGLTGTTGAA